MCARSRSGDAGTRDLYARGNSPRASARAPRTRANVFENVSARRALTQRARRRALATAARGPSSARHTRRRAGFADDARRCGGRGSRDRAGSALASSAREGGAKPSAGKGPAARVRRFYRPPTDLPEARGASRATFGAYAPKDHHVSLDEFSLDDDDDANDVRGAVVARDAHRARTHRSPTARVRPLLSPPRGAANSATATSRVAHRIRPPAVRRLRGRPFPRRFSARRPPRRQPRRFRLVAVALFGASVDPSATRPPSTRVVEPTRPRNPARVKPAAKRRKIKSRRKPGTESKAKASSARGGGGSDGRDVGSASAMLVARARGSRVCVRHAATSLWFPARRFSANPIPRRPARRRRRFRRPRRRREARLDRRGRRAHAREVPSRSRRDAESRRRARGHRRADVRERAHVFVRAVRAVGD